jgi:hypothetical protein
MGFCVNERKTIMKKKLGKSSEIRNAEGVQEKVAQTYQRPRLLD